MKQLSSMTNAQVIHWLNKTKNSINSGGYNVALNRKYELVDRYDDLREEAISRAIWWPYCESTHACPSHKGWDLYA
jgi:hypothetical protein